MMAKNQKEMKSLEIHYLFISTISKTIDDRFLLLLFHFQKIELPKISELIGYPNENLNTYFDLLILEKMLP